MSDNVVNNYKPMPGSSAIPFILLLILAGCNTRSADDLLKEAKTFDSAQNYSKAILLYDKILSLDINRSDIFLRRAIDKGLMNDVKGEIQDLQEIVRSEKNNVAVLYHLGVAYKNSGSYQKSIETFGQAIRIKSLEKEDEGQETGKLQNNFVSNITLPSIYFERAIAFYKVDSAQKAIDDLSFAISHNYSTKESYYYRALSFLKLKMIENACADLKKSKQNGMSEIADSIAKYCN